MGRYCLGHCQDARQAKRKRELVLTPSCVCCKTPAFLPLNEGYAKLADSMFTPAVAHQLTT